MVTRRRQPLAPERLEPRRPLAVDVLAPLADLAVDRGSSPAPIDLGAVFDLANVTGSMVRFRTSAALDSQEVFAELFDRPGDGRTRTTPQTVANFLAYVDAGRYTDTIVHRSVPGFVIQAGGFALTASGDPLVQSIPQFAPVVNEPGNTNARGTLAMAKLGGNPNSATNQFFVSLADNAAILDGQNGGFTAFGRVLGSGMDLVDAIAALPRYEYEQPFNELPAIGLDDPNAITRDNLVTIASVTRVRELVYSASSSAPGVAAASVTPAGGLVLSLVPGATGTSTITVRATSVMDAEDFAEETFLLTVVPPAAPRVNAVAGVAARELLVSRSDGQSLVAGPTVTLPDDGGWQEVVSGDFDRDGRTDVAMLSAAGNWWVAITPKAGPAAAPVKWADLRTDVPWRFPTVGDFTGDGRADIAVWNATSGAWRVLVSTGSGFDKASFGAWDPAGDWTRPLAGDFDGDGMSDLAGRDLASGAWHVARSSGTAFTTEIWRRQRRSIAWDKISAADFNGDGRTDLATWNPLSGAWRVLTSTGSGFDNSRFTFWDPSTDWADALAADFNGDGKSDLAARDAASGQVVVAVSQGTSFATAPWGQLEPAIAWQFATAGDFDADGQSDLVARDAASGAWRLLASTGQAFAGSPFGIWPTATGWTKSRGLRT